MLRGLIDEWHLRNEKNPDYVALFVGPNPDEVREFFLLCEEFGVKKATACVSDRDRNEETTEDIVSSVSDLGVEAVSRGNSGGDRTLYFSSGRQELVNVVGRLAVSVAQGESTPDDIKSPMIKERLPISEEPDLVINALGDRLADKMLWQTVYSELCFVEELNRRFFIKCLREYAERERRFGR